MKKFSILWFCCFFACYTFAQKKTTETNENLNDDDIEIPIMYQFDPEFEVRKQQKREDLQAKIAILDTLPISLKKRERLIKALYKDLNSAKFDKVLHTKTKATPQKTK